MNMIINVSIDINVAIIINMNMNSNILREFVCNYRHPGPRRVWKGGSDLQSLTPFPVDPVDPAQSNGRCDFEQQSHTFGDFCRKIVARKSGFEQQSHTFGHFCRLKF